MRGICDEFEPAYLGVLSARLLAAYLNGADFWTKGNGRAVSINSIDQSRSQKGVS